MVTAQEQAIHFFIFLTFAGALVGCYFGWDIINKEISANARFQNCTFMVLETLCTESACTVYGNYTPPGQNFVVDFHTSEFYEYKWDEIVTDFTPGDIRTCWYNIDNMGDVKAEQPELGNVVIVSQYALGILLSIIAGYSIKFFIYAIYSKNFVETPEWKHKIEDLWDPKHPAASKFPFEVFINLDLGFLLFILSTLSWTEDHSIIYVFGVVPIITSAIFLGAEKKTTKDALESLFTAPASKMNFLVVNLALSFGWCVIVIVSNVSLLLFDPWPRVAAYYTGLVTFSLYLVVKLYFSQFAWHLIGAYYSHDYVKTDE